MEPIELWLRIAEISAIIAIPIIVSIGAKRNWW